MINIEVRITGAIDPSERPAMADAIRDENVRRAATTPPLPALPSGTDNEIRTSYAAIYTPRIVAMHVGCIDASVEAAGASESFKEFRRKYSQATPAKQAAALAAGLAAIG